MPTTTGRPPPSAPSAPGASGLAAGATIGDHFVVVRKLGGGGMGEVFLAQHRDFPDKKYAIKVLRSEYSADPRFIAMLHDEAGKQARLEHDNVVGMYDFFQWQGHYCLLQSFVNGRTLAQLIAEQPGGLERSTALSLMEGILDGLDYAHSIGILHCDVKPANVIVDADGRPRVTDFGISRDIGAVGRGGALLGAGTPEYMSPEQISPPYAIDHRADVYSAGVVFYEMLCGHLPFDAGEAGATELPQLGADAPDVRLRRPDIPEQLARIVATALQRDPARRFQGCADFRQAIVEFRRRERWRRTWLPAIVVAGLAAVAGSGALYAWRQRVDEGVRLADQRVRQDRERVVQEQERNRLEQAANEQRRRETVAEALRNASASFNLLCREWTDYTIKRAGIDLAGGDLAKLFKARLAEMEGNMDRHAAGYAEAVRELSKADAAVVGAALDAQASAPSALQWVAAGVKADDALLRGGGALPPRSALIVRCPPPLPAGQR